MTAHGEELCARRDCRHPRRYHECDGAPGSCAASDYGLGVCDCLSFVPEREAARMSRRAVQVDLEGVRLVAPKAVGQAAAEKEGEP